MYHAELEVEIYTNGDAITQTVAVTCILWNKLSHDTLQTLVGDPLSLQLRGSLTTDQSLSLWAKEWQDREGGKHREREGHLMWAPTES